MATKNLARTVIEAGRTTRNKIERRYANRSARRKSRAYAYMLQRDPEAADEVAAPKRRRVVRWQRDKLSAAERWLESFVGQPWSQVRAEIARRFDTRTIAGQHIVYDHLLKSVDYDYHPPAFFYRSDLVIDDGGVLRRRARKRRERLRYAIA